MQVRASIDFLGLRCAAFGLALATGVAGGQQTDDLIVRADRPEVVVKRQAPNSPVHLVSLARHVSYADLDSRSVAGAEVLRQRVNEAAVEVCRKLDDLYPDSAPRGRACVQTAVKQAMHRLEADAAGSRGL